MLISARQILFLWSWLTGEVCARLLVAVVSEPPGQVLRDRFRIWEQVHSPPPPPLLPLSPCSSLSQEACGESDWRDPGPRGSAPLPSSSVPDGALRDTQASPEVPVGRESGRVSGFPLRLTALLRCWAGAVATPVNFTLCKIIHPSFRQRSHAGLLIGHAL